MTDDPFARLAVEFLARTGLRRGEFLNLTVDSVVQIGAAYWLHVPLGKLRTDRYIPLHPQLKELLDAWVAHRPANLREPWLFMDHGRRLGPESVRKAVQKVAREAGLDNVTPHQLRHTLATQAINRGMSLEAIAALLGHKSMRMTMVYAKISDRTVADEYFKVSAQVEALYDQPEATSGRRGGERRCASSAQRCTGGCSAMGTAPARLGWTATSSRSASRAPTSRPRSSFARRSSVSATTPPTRASRAAEDLRRAARAARRPGQGLMTTSARVPLFEVAANPDPDSTLPFLIRLPLPTGELVLKARDSWPRTAKVYCHRAERWPRDPEIVERVPIRS